MADLIDRQTAIETAIEAANKWDGGYSSEREGIIRKFFDKVPAVQPATSCSEIPNSSDTISRQAALDAIMGQPPELHYPSWYAAQIEKLPSAQPEIIRCKDCKWGAQDEVGRWFCRNLGCQIGNEDGSGFCADAERRADNANANA